MEQEQEGVKIFKNEAVVLEGKLSKIGVVPDFTSKEAQEEINYILGFLTARLGTTNPAHLF